MNSPPCDFGPSQSTAAGKTRTAIYRKLVEHPATEQRGEPESPITAYLDGKITPTTRQTQASVVMKAALITAGTLFALVLVGLAAYWIPFYTTEPDFAVTASRLNSGEYGIEIDPNFVVNSVYSVEIAGPGGVLAKREEPMPGIQQLTIPASVPAGTQVTVKCALQYDRLAPSITDKRQVVKLP